MEVLKLTNKKSTDFHISLPIIICRLPFFYFYHYTYNWPDRKKYKIKRSICNISERKLFRYSCHKKASSKSSNSIYSVRFCDAIQIIIIERSNEFKYQNRFVDQYIISLLKCHNRLLWLTVELITGTIDRRLHETAVLILYVDAYHHVV